jgi:hypothetical protein
MSSTSKQATRAHYKLPASLIFTPRELKQYRKWQKLCTTLKPIDCGYIPSAAEYDSFQQWLKKADSGYFSDVFDDISDHIKPATSPSTPTVASLCQHTIYPVDSQPHLRCPVCAIDIHVNYMKLLTRQLNNANGRPLPSTGTPSEQQENLYLAWSQGKLSTLRQVRELEKLSTKEAKWVEKHPDNLCEDVQSATKALEFYWFETAQCPSTKECNAEKCSAKKEKNVVFSDDTNFLPGRPADYFLKRSPRYEPGKYTIVDEQEDPEIVSEDSEDYTSVRVFVLGGPENTEEPDDEDSAEGLVQAGEPLDELEEDDGDSDWEDADSDEEMDDGSFVCFEDDEDENEDSNFIVFSAD